MRIELVVAAIKKRRQLMEVDIFDKPPVDHVEFVRKQGVWKGLGEALWIIEDAMRKANEDEYES